MPDFCYCHLPLRVNIALVVLIVSPHYYHFHFGGIALPSRLILGLNASLAAILHVEGLALPSI